MRIAYIFPSNLICGGHIEALQHITRLQDRGYSVFICLLDENIPADSQSFSWFPGFTGQVCHLSNFPKDIDISVATFWSTALASLKLPSKHKIYFVQCDERLFYNEPLLRSRVALTYLCNFIFMTEAKWVVNWLKRDFGHNAFYIPKGIDTNLMNSDKCIEPRLPNRFRVLIEGSMDSPFKRVKESIDACQNKDFFLGMPPHHMHQWSAFTFKSLENLFPIKLKKIVKEPLAKYHTSIFIDAYSHQFSYPIRKIFFNHYLTPLYKKILDSGLHQGITGMSLYVLYQKVED